MLSVCVAAKMLYILVLCRALLAAGVQTLSIDSQLGTSIEDCFERISIGEQLPSSAIYRNVSELTTRECEQICKQDKQCQTYDYGVGAKGNATCNLSNLDEKELKGKDLLTRHPDYDVYVRRIQCEQSPPTPLQPQFDDPGEGPAHRPVIRPEVDEPKRPVADFPLQDLRPFETNRPYPPSRPYRPPYSNLIDERPDDYSNSKPDFDRPPSYGLHKPQDIPYRPERPHHKPGSYDVLQFQDQYARPPRPYDPGAWRPDPVYPPQPADDIPDIYGPKPIRPNRPVEIPFRPENKPQYQYITRPTKKPRPPEDTGYNKPINSVQEYPTKPDPYGPSNPGPVGPPDRPYKPNRPNYDYPYRPGPSYNYNSQYASNYGQNQDNSIYLEIFDPPRPYKPNKPDRPSYGLSQDVYGPSYGYGSPGSYGYGGSYTNQNSYSQSQNSQVNYYGTGSITQLDDHDQNYNRPIHDSVGYRPQKPSYDSHNTGYGSQSSHKPIDQAYGDQTGGYGTPTTSKPNDLYHKPSYGSNQDSYVGSQGSYGGNQGSYGTTQPSYGSIQSDSSNQASYGGSTQSNRPSYGSIQGTYGQQDSHQSSYGSSQSQGSYQSNRPLSDNRPSYGSTGTSQVNRPTYGQTPSYNDDRPSYGTSRPPNKPLYDDNRPDGDTGSYGNKPSYNDEKPYSPPNNKPLYDDNRPDGELGPSYSGNQPSYGGNQPSYGSNKPSYDSNQPSYGNNQPSYGSNQPSYGSSSTQSNYGPSSTQSNYGSNPNNGYGNQGFTDKNTGYGNQKPIEPQEPGYKPDVRPVYEYEMEKPSNVPSYIVKPSGEVITSRPVTIGDYGERPAYGREPGPGHSISYKGKWSFKINGGTLAMASTDGTIIMFL